MPSVHPFVTFMEHINVDLAALYSDHSGRRAGSHALHAMAVLLEIRKKFDANTGCFYQCCIFPGRHGEMKLPSTLSRYVSTGMHQSNMEIRKQLSLKLTCSHRTKGFALNMANAFSLSRHASIFCQAVALVVLAAAHVGRQSL